MAEFNVGTIISTAVHEAYPGHYVQFLWQNQFPSKVRKLIGANTNIEGWAHYCEQMMLDQGYGQPPAPPVPMASPPDREAKLIRLGQLQDALLRDARFVNSIKLHTGLSASTSGTVVHRSSRRLLRQRRLPVPLRRPRRNQTRHRRRHLPLLHPRQTRNHEAPRRHERQTRHRLQPPAVPRHLLAPGPGAHQSHPQSHAPRRLTRALGNYLRQQRMSFRRKSSHLFTLPLQLLIFRSGGVFPTAVTRVVIVESVAHRFVGRIYEPELLLRDSCRREAPHHELVVLPQVGRAHPRQQRCSRRADIRKQRLKRRLSIQSVLE